MLTLQKLEYKLDAQNRKLNRLREEVCSNSGGDVETDPIFSASPAFSITTPNITSWNNQVTNGLTSTSTNTISNKSLLVNGTPASDQTTIEAWGDSHTAGAGQTPFTTTLASLSGLTVNNNGVGGETSTQVKTRFDAASTAKKARPTIIWVGFNDYSGDNTYTTVKSNIAAMVAALGHTSYLVIGEIMSTNGGFESGVAGWINKMSFNRYLAATYGMRYFDVHSFLLSRYDKTNTTDLQNYDDDVEPLTLRIDAQHFTSAANVLIGTELNRRLKDLGVGVTTLNRAEIIAPTLSPVLIGGVNKAPIYATYVEADKINIGFGGAILQDGLPIFKNNTTSRSMSIGVNAGKLSRNTLTTQVDNNFIGFQAGQNTIAAQFQSLTGIGTNALFTNTTGVRNTAVGQTALFSNNVGNNNTAIGAGALINANAYNNTGIGYNAGQNITSGGQNIIIGSLVDAPSATASGQINIGNLVYGAGATGTGATPTGIMGIGVIPTGVERLQVLGSTKITGVSTTSGSNPLFSLVGASNTAQTASTDVQDVLINLSRTVQFATGAKSVQRAMVITPPTYSAVGATNIASAATLAISGSPIAGTNVTIDTSVALWVQSGFTSLSGGVIIDTGMLVNSTSTFVGAITSSQYKLSALNTAPATATSTGTTGDIRWVNGFIYLCVATNTWQRATLTTW